MEFKYKCEDFLIVSEVSNEDIDISSEKNGNRSVVKITAKKNISLISAKTELNHVYSKKDLFFVNGYQSWTDSFEYSWSSKLKDASKIPAKLNQKYAFNNYGESFFYKYQKNVIHGFDVSYVKGTNPLWIASNNYKTAYLIIEHHKKADKLVLVSDVENIELKAGETLTVFDYFLTNDIENGQNEYFAQFTKPKAEKLFGYTSWYNHYQDINENIILGALTSSTEQFDLFQIDDGFEEYVGDWLKIDSKKFPNGLNGIVEKAHEKGMKAGIWLAPFAVEEKSSMFRENKDWLCKDENGNPIKTGSNWSGFYSLDISNPDVIQYVKDVLKFYKNIGFDFFKLDFLYAVSVMPQKGMSRAQTAQKAYELLRSELRDRLILGCGACVSNCFDLFDYLRIGPDVSLKFDDVWYMRMMHRERISTKVTLRNTIYRSIFDGKVFLNDPDVFLLRDHNISLSKKQREALTTINSLFGSLMMTSDNPKHYKPDQLNYLEKCIPLFKNAKVTGYRTVKNKIYIFYSYNDTNHEIAYDIKKGVIDGQI